jgi:peptidoglycan/LPS O-acetylase OafA/YrhL
VWTCTRRCRTESAIKPGGVVIKEETGQHLNHLDGWRGLAILLVLLGHFWGDYHIWSGISASGVDLFFVLSGRLMAEILFVRRAPLPTFFLRRFSRVYPALAAFVLVTTIAFHGTQFSQGVVAAAVALTMTLNYAMIYAHPIGLMDHLWSLCVEEHGYIILAAIAFCARRRTLSVAVVIAALGLAALLNGVIRTDLLRYDTLLTRWRTDVSIAGIFIAGALWLYLRTASVPLWVSPVAFALAVVFRLQPMSIFSLGFSTIALAVTVVTLDASPATVRRALSLRGLRQVGLWSYSLYLWQQPFYKLHRFGDWSAPYALAWAAGCALLSFYLVEGPARRWLNTWFARARHARR